MINIVKRLCGFSNGVDPNDYFRNEPHIYELISEYTRSPRFKDCRRYPIQTAESRLWN